MNDLARAAYLLFGILPNLFFGAFLIKSPFVG